MFTLKNQLLCHFWPKKSAEWEKSIPNIPFSEIEPTDHPLGPGQIFGIYAKGQDLDVGGELYKKDQLKYHGSTGHFLPFPSL